MDILHLVFTQISVDIFLLDWERPHPVSADVRATGPTSGKLTDDSAPAAGSSTTKATKELAVSVWRTYLVANEWNELQTMRKTNLALQIVLVVFILRVRASRFAENDRGT